MTEKELHKLRRHDLLQLLLAQGREAAQLRTRIEETTAELEQVRETNQRFIERMDEKDAQIGKLKERLDEKDIQVDRFKGRLKEKDDLIEKLKGRLDQKDIQIGECRSVIEEYRSGRIFEMGGQVSIAEVGQKLEGIFTAAQKAVDQYLEEIHGKAELQDTIASGGETVPEGKPEPGLAGTDKSCGEEGKTGSSDAGGKETAWVHGSVREMNPGKLELLPAEIKDTGERHEKKTG